MKNDFSVKKVISFLIRSEQNVLKIDDAMTHFDFLIHLSTFNISLILIILVKLF